ncbi:MULTISPECIES: hypothetical protein [Halomonadaceae]|uniref:CBS domain-containing protein n=1 Tax=Vreelandella titanicae TaxID=664683 RepID=A0AAP9NM64_9GAMM|nr:MULTISPECIES: hypothetical protein [Halomonas]QKS24675.1 hypothetical protein FX987_02457 [Halomonas titanicae]CDG54102.1 hypothetical protein HALA3H3_690065 [Halomonas sp. A3H3]SDI95248.1 hypothetical protein SAMN04487867_118113 [Halomonas titanicae]
MQRIEECLALEAALPLFDLHGTDAVEVFDTHGQVIGVLTRTDIEKATARRGARPVGRRVYALPRNRH